MHYFRHRLNFGYNDVIVRLEAMLSDHDSKNLFYLSEIQTLTFHAKCVHINECKF